MAHIPSVVTSLCANNYLGYKRPKIVNMVVAKSLTTRTNKFSHVRIQKTYHLPNHNLGVTDDSDGY